MYKRFQQKKQHHQDDQQLVSQTHQNTKSSQKGSTNPYLKQISQRSFQFAPQLRQQTKKLTISQHSILEKDVNFVLHDKRYFLYALWIWAFSIDQLQQSDLNIQIYHRLLSNTQRLSSFLTIIKPMQLFKDTFSGLKPKLSGAAANAINVLKSTINSHIEPNRTVLLPQIIQVSQNLFHMPFPTQQIISLLSQQVLRQYGRNFLIWNVSENKYDTSGFMDQVCDNCYPAYPIVPMNELLLICSNIKKWLELAPTNVAVVHCKQNKSRSAILLAVYLYLDKKFEYVDEALIYVNKLLGIRAEETIFSSQRLCIKNVMNLFSGFQTNPKALRITRIMINAAPDLVRRNSDGTCDSFKPCLEIFQKNNKIYSQDHETQSGESVRFEVKKVVRDDFLIWIKHSHTALLRYSCLRVMLNTNFIDEKYLRITDNNMDITKNIFIPDNFFIDIYFEDVSEEEESGLKLVQRQVRQAFKIPEDPKTVSGKIDIVNAGTKAVGLLMAQKRDRIKEQFNKELQKIIVSKEESKPEDFDIDHIEEPEPVNKEEKPTEKSERNIEKMIQECVVSDENQNSSEEDIEDYISKLESKV